MYYSIIGLMVVLAWVMVAIYNYDLVSNSHPSEFISSSYFTGFYNNFLYGKLFTFICFVFGVRIYIDVETEGNSRAFIIKLALMLIVLLGFAWFSSLFLVAFLIALFGILVRILPKIKPEATLYLFFGLLFLLVLLAIFSRGLNLSEPFFIDSYNNPISNLLSGHLSQYFMGSSAHLQLVFGFIIIVLGFWAGATRWLVEYHFHYEALKRLFQYSLVLFFAWLVLNYFNVYLLITKWKIGEVFYLFDALTLNVVVVFMYVFLLIYLENFRWGKHFLKLLEHLGKLWFVNVLILLVVSYFIDRQAFQLNVGTYVLDFFMLFLIVALLNVGFSKFYMNRFCLPLNKFIDKI